MIFTLFKDIAFEVNSPEALIEAYCFQSDFFSKYDFKFPTGDDRFERIRFIGARIREEDLSECRRKISNYREFDEFDRKGLDWFLKRTTVEERSRFVSNLAELTHKLDEIPRIGLSKATKILHTRYHEIIPMIDNPLQRQFKKLRPNWKNGDWHKMLFKDYYDNFLVKETYENLCKIHDEVSFLNLTKVRVFDILWWSLLKSKNPEYEGLDWKTVRLLT